MIIYTEIGQINSDDDETGAILNIVKSFEYYMLNVPNGPRTEPMLPILREDYFTSEIAFYKTLDRWNGQFTIARLNGNPGWIYWSK